MKKLIWIIPFILLFSLFSVYAINCAFVSPANNEILRAGSIINITYSNGGLATTDEIVTLIVNASSPSTRNSSALTRLIVNQTNITITGTTLSTINVSLPVQSSDWVEDSNDYTLVASVENATARVACNATRTGIILDRTVPSTATGITYTSPVGNTQTITATINAINSNRCYIRFGGNPLITMVRSGTNNSVCTYTAARGTNSPADGDYQFIIRADDRSNVTDSAIQSVTIKANQNGDGSYLSNAIANVPSGQSILGGSSNPFAPKDNKIVVILVLLGVFLYFKNKK